MNSLTAACVAQLACNPASTTFQMPLSGCVLLVGMVWAMTAVVAIVYVQAAMKTHEVAVCAT